MKKNKISLSKNIMNKKKLKVCLIQIEGKETPKLNSKLLKKYLIKSLKFTPDIIFTPECLNVITSNKNHLKRVVTTQNNCPVLNECKNFAKEHNIFVSVGSLLLKQNNSKKLLNRSFFINNKGKIISYYDKIHLFDVNINKKETHQESKIFKKGNKIVVVNSPWGKFGLTICYDIRFPLLYRKLVKLGCRFLLIPAAFTVPTGKAHWKILLQSRAIENTCYIIAAAQCGKHHGSRKTYGHSSIIDPWGQAILEASTKPGIFSKTLDLELINSVRLKIPSIYIN